MARKHRFVIVVMLGAAVVAGFFALGRSMQLGASSKTAAPALVSARARSLDRLEAQLRRQLAALPDAAPTPQSRATPATSVGVPYLTLPEASDVDEDDGDHGARGHEALGQTDGDD